MKSILLTIAAATMLWIGGTFTSTADAQYVRYGRGYYGAPRYYGGYNYAPRYYRAPYRTYYRGYNYPYYGYRAPYYSGYRGGYYSRPYYGGGYYRPGVSVGVGPARIGIGF